MSNRFLPSLRDSLRGRLVVLAGISGVATCLLAATLAWMAHGHERAALVRDLQGTSRAITRVVDREFNSRAKVLRYLSTSPSLLAGDWREFHDRASRMVDGECEWIVLTDLEGQQVINTHLPYGSALPRMTFAPEAFDAWRRGVAYVSNLTTSPAAQRQVVGITVPVEIAGQLRYGLSMIVTPDALMEGLELSQVSPHYVTAITDRTGTIVARHPSGGRFVGRKAMPDVVRMAEAGEPAVAKSVTLEGVAVLTAFTPSSTYGWGIVIGAPQAILGASLRRLTVFSVAATGIMLVALAIVAWWILRGVLHDMRSLQSDAESFARGRLVPSREWTLAETKTAADAMRRTLRQLHNELRHRADTEAALRLADQRFRLAAANDGIILFEQDAELRYTWLHPDQPHIIGQTDVNLVSPAHSHQLARIKTAVLQTGTPGRGDVTAEFSRGTRHYSLFVAPRRDAAGKIIGIAGAALDITERKLAEEALAAAKQDLLLANSHLEEKVRARTSAMAELVRQMEEFTSSVSHDLRAPIRAIRTYADVLTEDFSARLGPDGRAILDRILRNGERMDRLISDLLAFSRVSREQVNLQPVSLQIVVNDQFHEQTALRGREATLVVEGSLPDVLAQPTLLHQALGNLLSNAIKFVPATTRPLVHVTAEERGSRVRVWVGDNGIGIAPELQPRLFRIFERLHPEEPYDGTGMGLAIVRRAIERMDGSVGVESAAGRGSRFWFELERASTPARQPARERGNDAALV